MQRSRRIPRGVRATLATLTGAWAALALAAAPGAPDVRVPAELARDVQALARLQAAMHELERARRDDATAATTSRAAPVAQHAPACAGSGSNGPRGVPGRADGTHGATSVVQRTWRSVRAPATCDVLESAPERERPARSVQYFSDGRHTP